MNICRIATVPFFFQHHLREQIIETVAAGHRVTLIFGSGRELSDLSPIDGVVFREIELPRRISPWADLKALWRLFWHFKEAKYDLVHSTTPKAGLLSAISSFLARVPIRVHTFTGQPWIEKRGLIRAVAKGADRCISLLSSRLYTDSFTQREFLVSEGICNLKKTFVLGSGSLAGVNLSKFNRDYKNKVGATTRQELEIENNEIVVTFIGRLTAEKGVEELIAAFEMISVDGEPCVLLLVGPEDTEHGKLSHQTLRKIRSNQKIKQVGYTAEPEKYLAVTDIFCLPSYREGFGNVVIEAAAMGVPTVGSDIIGLRDAVVDGKTGLLVPVKNSEELAKALKKLISDPRFRCFLGDNALKRSLQDFDSKKVNSSLLNNYQEMFNKQNTR